MKDIQLRCRFEDMRFDLHIKGDMRLQNIQIGIKIQSLTFRRKICAKQMDLDSIKLRIIESMRVDELTNEG